MAVVVSTFYKFVSIADCSALQLALLDICRAHDIRGTILIAHEGLNATVSGAAEAIEALHGALKADPRFRDLTTKRSEAADHPFERLKVKIKPEIVTFGAPEADPSKRVGRYVKPQDWNALISDPDVVVIDARNSYEVGIGTFAGALDPSTRSFREFQDFVARRLAPAKHQKIAMFCTGGIRCEKASSYLLSQGFEDVHHLEGGILKYLEAIPPEASLWRGECFVFDARVALEHGVTEGSHTLCGWCGSPVLKSGVSGAREQCPNCPKLSMPATPASRPNS